MEMEMGCGSRMVMIIIVVWILISVVKMEDEVVTRRKIYSCWGGCYNNCFLAKKTDDNLQCYFNCLNNCTSSSPLDYESFCKDACYLEICIPLSFVGANVGDCFLGSCANLCSSKMMEELKV